MHEFDVGGTSDTRTTARCATVEHRSLAAGSSAVRARRSRRAPASAPSAPTPAARSGCRRRSTASSASGRPTAASEPRIIPRWPGAWIPPARWRAGRGLRADVLAIAGPDPNDPACAQLPAHDSRRGERRREGPAHRHRARLLLPSPAAARARGGDRGVEDARTAAPR